MKCTGNKSEIFRCIFPMHQSNIDFFEIKDHNVYDIHTLVDILVGKQTTNHQSVLKS